MPFYGMASSPLTPTSRHSISAGLRPAFRPGLTEHGENFYIGFNVNGSGNRDDTAKSGLSILFEKGHGINGSGYANDALVFRHVRKDGTTGATPFTFEMPQEGPLSEVNGKLQLGSLSFVDAATGLSWASLSLSGDKLWHFLSGVTFSNEVNNMNFLRQHNAAGTGYFNIKVDSSDRWHFDTAGWFRERRTAPRAFSASRTAAPTR